MEPGYFMTDWAIYHYDQEQGEWVRMFWGARGEARDSNPLFTRDQAWKKADGGGKDFAASVDAKLEDKALASIMSVLQKSA